MKCIVNFIMVYVVFVAAVPFDLYSQTRCKGHEVLFNGRCVHRLEAERLKEEAEAQKIREKKEEARRRAEDQRKREAQRKAQRKAQLAAEREKNQKHIDDLYQQASWLDIMDAEYIYREIVDDYDSSYQKYREAQSKLNEIASLKRKTIPVEVITDPSNATVWVNDNVRSYSDEPIFLNAGTHNFSFAHSKFRSLKYELAVNKSLLDKGELKLSAVLAYDYPEKIKAADLGLRYYEVPQDIVPMYNEKKVLTLHGKVGVAFTVVGGVVALTGLVLLIVLPYKLPGGLTAGCGALTVLIGTTGGGKWVDRSQVQDNRNTIEIGKNKKEQAKIRTHNRRVDEKVKEANRRKREAIDEKNSREGRGKVELVD
jgi:hypothetical protein